MRGRSVLCWPIKRIVWTVISMRVSIGQNAYDERLSLHNSLASRSNNGTDLRFDSEFSRVPSLVDFGIPRLLPSLRNRAGQQNRSGGSRGASRTFQGYPKCLSLETRWNRRQHNRSVS